MSSDLRGSWCNVASIHCWVDREVAVHRFVSIATYFPLASPSIVALVNQIFPHIM